MLTKSAANPRSGACVSQRSRVITALATGVALAFLAAPPELGAARRQAERGVVEPISNPDSLPGTRLFLVNPRSGTPLGVGFQRFHSAGSLDLNWTPDTSLALRAALNLTRSVSDGANGSFVAWADDRSGDSDVRLQRFGADGRPFETWPAASVSVCRMPGSQYQVDLAPDGSGGAYLVWTDHRSGGADVYAHRIDGSGLPHEGWPEHGKAICSVEGDQTNPRIVSDGNAGAIIVWEDRRSGSSEVYLQRISGDGSPTAGWPESGVAASGGRKPEYSPRLFDGHAGRGLLLWKHQAGIDQFDLVASSIDLLGGPPIVLPTVTITQGATDIGGLSTAETGGQVVVLAWAEWRGSEVTLRAQQLSVGNEIEALGPEGGIEVSTGEVSRGAPALLADTDSTITIAWTAFRERTDWDVHVSRLRSDGGPMPGWSSGGVAACVASGTQYAPTLAPDGPDGILVSWRDASMATVMQDSAMSSLALSRGLVRLVSAAATPGHARVVWRAMNASDEMAIRIQRRIGESPWAEFAQGAPDDSGLIVVDDRTVSDGSHVAYRLVLKSSEFDLAAEPVALEIPSAPTVLLLHQVRALRHEPALLLSFALPRGEAPRVDLFDVQGRRMLASRLEGLEPGEQVVRWPVPSRMASGVYFLRLAQGAQRRDAKVVYVR